MSSLEYCLKYVHLYNNILKLKINIEHKIPDIYFNNNYKTIQRYIDIYFYIIYYYNLFIYNIQYSTPHVKYLIRNFSRSILFKLRAGCFVSILQRLCNLLGWNATSRQGSNELNRKEVGTARACNLRDGNPH